MKEKNENCKVIILWNQYGYYHGGYDGSCYDINGIAPCLKVGGGVPRIFDKIENE